MEAITLGEISNVLVFIAGILGAGGSIALFFGKRFGKVMAEQLKPTNDKIDSLQASISEVDMANCKNYLVQTISTLEAGRTVDKVALERFWENYDHYTEMGGNSYIHTAVERLKKEGKL